MANTRSNNSNNNDNDNGDDNNNNNEQQRESEQHEYYAGDDGARYTVDQAVDGAGFGKFQVMMLCFTGLAWMGDAMEMMLLSFLGPSAGLALTPGVRLVTCTGCYQLNRVLTAN